VTRASEAILLYAFVGALAPACRAPSAPAGTLDASAVAREDAGPAGRDVQVTRVTVPLPDGGVAEVTTTSYPGSHAVRTYAVGGRIFRSEGFYGGVLVAENESAEGRENERWYEQDGGLARERITTFAPTERMTITSFRAGRRESRLVQTSLADGGVEIRTEVPLPDGGWWVEARRVRSRSKPEY
jgi:hypothetical protein